MLLTACKSTSSIITSKDVAVKKGIYTEPVIEKNYAVKKIKNNKNLANRQIVQSTNQKKYLRELAEFFMPHHNYSTKLGLDLVGCLPFWQQNGYCYTTIPQSLVSDSEKL